MGRHDKTTEKGFRLVGAVNCEKVNIWGNWSKIRIILVRFLYADTFMLSASDNKSSLPCMEAELLHKGNLCPAFRQMRGGQRVLLCLPFLSCPQFKIIPSGKGEVIPSENHCQKLYSIA